ncbi:hypothetical protein HYFRA_00011885 [Hymenoscyphus fraxineus]|uniref:BZIP transcription factor n=1 Tax=Hymenoscyphus fraxineus TaxID=746836 RepID=A0A9N9KZY4_9HELO|nr:hypothetical protein HYFRA_00011885 [Hymenoscyphus fraxineus]
MASLESTTSTDTTTSSSSSISEQGSPAAIPQELTSTASSSETLKRPKMSTRKSSGTIIVPRDSRIQMEDGEEEFDEDDARTMSPRRSSQDVEQMSRDARAHLDEHAKKLQQSLLEIFNRIEAVREEHDKLDNNNKFLQKYIGDLMSTSKITSSGAGGRKK